MVGDLPVMLESSTPADNDEARRGGKSPTRAAEVSSVRVRVADRAATSAAGVSGALLELSRADGVAAPGRVRLRLEYERFASAFGADFGHRLHLVSLPECALTRPADRRCQARTDLRSTNAGGVVSADVKVAGDPATVVGVTAGPSSGGATWSATSLSPTYGWTAGGHGGEFTYRYPLRVPPAPGGPAPDLALSYSSGATDGQTLAANGQTSWVGEGWDLQTGFIERSYRSCRDDGGSTGDLCWFSPYNATMVFGGRATDLVRDNASGVWHAADDDGLRIEPLKDPSSGNGDNDGDYWRVTTQDGTQYFFGRHKRYAADPDVTNSTLLTPVYGNHAGEPCNSADGFAASWCTQAYRWYLDYVVDPRGNSMTYFYTKFSGTYGRNNNTGVAAYDLSGTLDRIEYGTRAGAEGNASAPMRVLFTKTGRCFASCQQNTADYPDTPWDLYCSSSTSCPNALSPVFFTPYRLVGATTQVWQAAAAAYRNVDRWDLGQTFPPAGDFIPPAGNDTPPHLWLQALTHVGYAADGTTTLAEPAITFGGTQMFNRVDWGSDIGVSPYVHYRLTSITNGVGGQTVVAYSSAQCFRGWKPVPAFNPLRCFPQFSKPTQAPVGWHWFHKYVVTQVTDRDLTGGSPDEVTTYTYSTAGASDVDLWHHDRNEISRPEHTSWALWRGYPTVTVAHGPAGGPQTVTSSLAYRGMDGDVTKPASSTNPWGPRRAGLLTALGTPDVTGAVSGQGGLCLQPVGGGTVNGTPVQVAPCTGGPQQVWQPQLSNLIKHPATGRCLDVAGAGTANGTLIQLLDCTGGVGQIWGWRPDGSLINPNSRRCLDAANWATTPANTQLFDCTGSWNQRWMPQPDGTLTSPQAYRCIEPESGGTTNGTHVVNATCTSAANQQWQYRTNKTLRNPTSGRCLDVTGAGTASGTPVQLWNCTGSAHQMWEPQPDGTLKSPSSGRCLDAGTNANPGLQLTISDCTGALSQQWTANLVDHDGLHEFIRQTSSHDGPAIATATIHTPTVTQTATRSAPVPGGQDVIARMVRGTSTHTRTRIAATNSWRWTQTNTSYDSYGLPTDVVELGDLATTDDDTCTNTIYATRDTDRWFVNYPTQQLTTDCTPNPGDANYLAATDTYYDNLGWGQTPTRGLVTKSNALASVSDGVRTWKQASRAEYDTQGRVVASFDALDRQTTTSYTPGTGGPLTQVRTTNPLGHEGTTTFEPGHGSVTRMKDANDKITEAAYDPLGRLTRVWIARPTTTAPDLEYTYTLRADGPNAMVSKRLGPNGNHIISCQLYDGRLRPRQTQTPAPQANGGRVIADLAYDARGLVVKDSTFWNNTAGPNDSLVTFADTAVANQRRYAYDTLGRRTVDALWSGNALKWQTTATYDGDRSTVTPPAGGIATTSLTDADGKTIELRRHMTGTPTGTYQATTYRYDRLSRLTRVTDPAGNTWTTSYDLRGRPMSMVDPDRGAITMTYDDAGQLLTTTDARGITLTRTYDPLGRQTALWHGPADTGTKVTQATYDTLAKGYPTSITRVASGSTYTTTITDYDERYRPLGSAVTIPAAEGALAGTWTTTNSYNVDGSIASTTYPPVGGLATETVTSTYDASGFLLKTAGQDTYVSATSYHPWGDVSQRVLGSGSRRVRVTTAVDEATRRLVVNQTETESQTSPETWVDQLTENYGYDPAGNVTSIGETRNGATVSAQCFRYDPLQRLTEAWSTTATTCQASPSRTDVGGPDAYWTSYRYDNAENRTQEVRHAAGGDTTRAYAFPAAGQSGPHRLLSVTATGAGTGTDTYGHDPTGNITTRNVSGQPSQTLTWDVEGHLATVTTSAGTTSYRYDAVGNRLLSRDPTGATLYLDGTEVRADASGTITATRIYGNGAVRTTTGGLFWQTADHHGTAQLTITATTLAVTRRKFDPFGNPRGTQPAWPTTHGYVDGTTDPTGLTHLGAREYDPGVGQFTSTDPVMDVDDPAQLNACAYSGSNPVTNSDPTGLCVGCAAEPEKLKPRPKRVAQPEKFKPRPKRIAVREKFKPAKSPSSGKRRQTAQQKAGDTCPPHRGKPVKQRSATKSRSRAEEGLSPANRQPKLPFDQPPSTDEIVNDTDYAHAWCTDYPLSCAHVLQRLIEDYERAERRNQERWGAEGPSGGGGGNNVRSNLEALRRQYYHWLSVHGRQTSATATEDQLDGFGDALR